jgi:hypothetical protein
VRRSTHVKMTIALLFCLRPLTSPCLPRPSRGALGARVVSLFRGVGGGSHRRGHVVVLRMHTMMMHVVMHVVMHVHHRLGCHRLGAGWRARCCVLCNGITAEANRENDCSDKGLDHGRGSFLGKPPKPSHQCSSRILSEPRMNRPEKGEQVVSYRRRVREGTNRTPRGSEAHSPGAQVNLQSATTSPSRDRVRGSRRFHRPSDNQIPN